MSKLYVVENIIGKRQINGIVEYRVKWKGYSDRECTWEPKTSFCQSMDVVRRYERSIRDKKQSLSQDLNDVQTGAADGFRRSSSAAPRLERGKKITDDDTLGGSSKLGGPPYSQPVKHESRSPPRTPERPKRAATGFNSGSGGKREQLELNDDLENDSDTDYGDPPALEPEAPLDTTASVIDSKAATSPIAERTPTSSSSSSSPVSSSFSSFGSNKSSVSAAAKISAPLPKTKTPTVSPESKTCSLSPKLEKASDGSTEFKAAVISPELKTPARSPKSNRLTKSKSSASSRSPKDAASARSSKSSPSSKRKTTTRSPRASTSARSPSVDASTLLASTTVTLKDAPHVPSPARVSEKQTITQEIAKKAISSPPMKTRSSEKPQTSSSGSKVVNERTKYQEPAIKSILKRRIESTEPSAAKRVRSPGGDSSSFKNTKLTEPKSCKRKLAFESTGNRKLFACDSVFSVFNQPQPSDNRKKDSHDKPKPNISSQDEQVPARANINIQELGREVEKESSDQPINIPPEDDITDESLDVDIEGLEIEISTSESVASTSAGHVGLEGGPTLPTSVQNSVAVQTTPSIACHQFGGLYVGLHGTTGRPFTSVSRIINVLPAPEPGDRYIYLAEYDDRSRAWITAEMARSYPQQLIHFFQNHVPLEFSGTYHHYET